MITTILQYIQVLERVLRRYKPNFYFLVSMKCIKFFFLLEFYINFFKLCIENFNYNQYIESFENYKICIQYRYVTSKFNLCYMEEEYNWVSEYNFFAICKFSPYIPRLSFSEYAVYSCIISVFASRFQGIIRNSERNFCLSCWKYRYVSVYIFNV